MGVGTTLVLTGYLRKYEGVFTLKSMQKKLQDALIKIFPYCCKIQALSYIEKNRSSSIKIRRVTVVFFLIFIIDILNISLVKHLKHLNNIRRRHRASSWNYVFIS